MSVNMNELLPITSSLPLPSPLASLFPDMRDGLTRFLVSEVLSLRPIPVLSRLDDGNVDVVTVAAICTVI